VRGDLDRRGPVGAGVGRQHDAAAVVGAAGPLAGPGIVTRPSPTGSTPGARISSWPSSDGLEPAHVAAMADAEPCCGCAPRNYQRARKTPVGERSL
jgi:hypothetical protein